jgi:hypothetical protein
MSKLSDIAPTLHQRIIDLVRAAGVNVADWGNFAGGKEDAGRNPNYCYEWAFVEPKKLIVLNLWYESFQERDGVIWQDLDLREDARKYAKLTNKAVWAKRALRMDKAIQTALNDELPVRVVVCDGQMRGRDVADTKASEVAKRLLDPVTWNVTAYSWETGRCTLSRDIKTGHPNIKNLEGRFHDKTIEVYDLAKKLCGYNATRFLQKIRRVGGLAAAKAWLDPHSESSPTKGFLKLFDADLLEISLEALVLRNPWNQLFGASELAVAAARLRAYGYRGEELIDPSLPGPTQSLFTPKSDEEYTAFICGGVQRRSRYHESLVKAAADFLVKEGASVSNPHPLDLLMQSPLKIIFEAKSVRKCGAGSAIREAIGQLHEYRHFRGPKDASLCILLDEKPADFLVTYVENVLRFQIMWSSGTTFSAGPETLRFLSNGGMTISKDEG